MEVYKLILESCRDLSGYIEQKTDLATFEMNISKINFCFSLITLDPSKSGEIIDIYLNLLRNNTLELLQYSLTIDIDENRLLVDFLQMLCYLYTAFKYERIRKYLEKTFLFDINTKWGLMLNIEDKRL